MKVGHKTAHSTIPQRPELAQRSALDLCAVIAHRAKGPALIVSSNAVFVRELLKRLDVPATLLVSESNRMLMLNLQMNLVPEIADFDLKVLGELDSNISTIVWVEPSKEELEFNLHNFEQILSLGGVLCVLTLGQLGRFSNIRSSLARVKYIISIIKQSSLSVQDIYGIRDCISILRGIMAGQLSRLGLRHLADQCYIKIREDLIKNGNFAKWSVMVLIVARKL